MFCIILYSVSAIMWIIGECDANILEKDNTPYFTRMTHILLKICQGET